MKKIYFDEAGNTGADLLNTDQKAFILCSNNFNKHECNDLLKLFESGDELHFVKLKKSQKGRDAVIKLLNHKLITEEKIGLYVANKEFATVAQIVDQLIESVFHNIKIDIYKYGLNIQWTNFIFYFGNFFWDKSLYEKFINNFIKMFKLKNQESIDSFYKSVKDLINNVDDEYKKLLFPVVESKKIIKNILFNTDKFTIDITLSCFLVLCNHWYKEIGEKFDVIFDNSKQIEHYNDYIEFVKNLKVPLQEVGFGSRKMTFPTQINSLSLTDSEHEINIQISDIIASSLAFMYNNKNIKQEAFVKRIQDSKILNLENVYTLWPSYKISPKELNMENAEGINILDFLADQTIKNNKQQL